MNSKEKHIPTEKSAGRRPADPESSGNSYVVYNRCSDCPVHVYRDAVCNDNLRALILEGEPSEEVLREARQALTVEFAELSGDTGLITANKGLARTIGYQYRIQALAVASIIPDHPEAVKLFARYGWGKLPVDVQIKRANDKIKEYTVVLDKETARQQKHAAKQATKRLTAADFNRQMVIVSKWVGFHLSDRITLAELAGYFKSYSETLKLYGNSNAKYGTDPAVRN